MEGDQEVQGRSLRSGYLPGHEVGLHGVEIVVPGEVVEHVLLGVEDVRVLWATDATGEVVRVVSHDQKHPARRQSGRGALNHLTPLVGDDLQVDQEYEVESAGFRTVCQHVVAYPSDAGSRHWPLFALLILLLPDGSPSWLWPLAAVPAILLAVVSYRYVEAPLRRRIRAALARHARPSPAPVA